MYRFIPGFAVVSERAYAFLAQRRGLLRRLSAEHIRIGKMNFWKGKGGVWSDQYAAERRGFGDASYML